MGGVIRGDDGHDIWLNIDRRAFRMSLCTIQMLHAVYTILCIVCYWIFKEYFTQWQRRKSNASTKALHTILFILEIYLYINTIYIYIYIYIYTHTHTYIVDPQRFPLRWQPSRWLSVERGRKQTVRRHFGIATAGEWAGSFAATVGCFQRHEVMDPIFLFYNRRSTFLLVGETLYFVYLSVLHFLLPRPISIKFSS